MLALYQTSISKPSPEIAVVAAIFPPGRALDLGCGIGTESFFLARHGWRVEGVDLSDRELKIARRRRAKLRGGENVELVRGNITNGYLPQHRGFDLINDRLFTNNLTPGAKSEFGKKGASFAEARRHMIRLAAHALKPNGVWIIRYRQAKDPNWGAPSFARLSKKDREYAAKWFEIGTELGYRSMFDNLAWIRLSIVVLKRNNKPFKLEPDTL